MKLQWREWSLVGFCSLACARTVSNADEAVGGGAGFADAGQGSTNGSGGGGDGGSAPTTGGRAATTGGRATTGGASTGGAEESGGGGVDGEANGGAGTVDPPACYSPDENLEGSHDPGAMGCPCNEANEFDTCRTSPDGSRVALTCVDGVWTAVEDGRCAQTGCFVTRRLEIALSGSLLEWGRRRLARSGPELMLTDWELATSTWASLATLSWTEGVLGRVEFTPLGALLGTAVLKVCETHRLVMVDHGDEDTGSTRRLRASAWQASSSEPLGVTELFEVEYSALKSDFDLVNSTDGERAVFAFGNHGSDDQITAAVLDSDARPVADPYVVTTSGTSWSCLEVLPTISAASLSFFEGAPKGGIDWHVVELDADGAAAFETAVHLAGTSLLPGRPCPHVVRSEAAYYVTIWSDDDLPHMAVLRRMATATTRQNSFLCPPTLRRPRPWVASPS